jgi:hypothetical protein
VKWNRRAFFWGGGGGGRTMKQAERVQLASALYANSETSDVHYYNCMERHELATTLAHYLRLSLEGTARHCCAAQEQRRRANNLAQFSSAHQRAPVLYTVTVGLRDLDLGGHKGRSHTVVSAFCWRARTVPFETIIVYLHVYNCKRINCT